MKNVLRVFCLAVCVCFSCQLCYAEESVDSYCSEVSKKVFDCVFDDGIDIAVGGSYHKKCPNVYFSSNGIDVHGLYLDFWDGYDDVIRNLQRLMEKEKPANIFDKKYKKLRQKLKESHKDTFLKVAKEKCLNVRRASLGGAVYIQGYNDKEKSSKSASPQNQIKETDCAKALQKRPVKINSQIKCSKSTAKGDVYGSALNGYKTACLNAVSNVEGQNYNVGPKQDGEFYIFTCEMVTCKDPENYKLNETHTKCVKKVESQQQKQNAKSVEIKSIVDEINASANQMKIGHILPSDDVKHPLNKDVKSAIEAWDKACLEITKPDGVETTDIEKGFPVKDGGGANARRCIVKSCKTSEGYKRSSDKTKCEKTNSSTQNDDTDKQNNQTKQDKQRERKITEFTSIIEESIKSGVKIGTSVTVPNDADLNYSDGRVDERIDAALDLWLEECKKSKTEGVVEAAVLDDRKTPKKTLTCYIKDCEKGYHKDGNVCLEDGVVQLSDKQIKCEQDGGNWDKKSNKCQKIRQTKEAKEREKCAKNENKLWLPGEGCVENNEENRKKEANLYKDEDDVDNICYGETKEKHQNLYDEAVKKIKAAYKAKAEEIIDDCKNFLVK